jgi:threonine/homoserine efflux transporter RhtA
VLGSVLGLLFLHQPVTLVQGIGIITITVAAIGAVRHDSRATPRLSPAPPSVP